MTYLLTATNTGPAVATAVVVTDTLPAGAVFVAASDGGTVAGSVVTWPAIATLASGTNRTLSVTIRYPAGGSYQNIAAVTSGSPDPDMSNNRATASTAVKRSATSTLAPVTSFFPED